MNLKKAVHLVPLVTRETRPASEEEERRRRMSNDADADEQDEDADVEGAQVLARRGLHPAEAERIAATADIAWVFFFGRRREFGEKAKAKEKEDSNERTSKSECDTFFFKHSICSSFFPPVTL